MLLWLVMHHKVIFKYIMAVIFIAAMFLSSPVYANQCESSNAGTFSITLPLGSNPPAIFSATPQCRDGCVYHVGGNSSFNRNSAGHIIDVSYDYVINSTGAPCSGGCISSDPDVPCEIIPVPEGGDCTGPLCDNDNDGQPNESDDDRDGDGTPNDEDPAPDDPDEGGAPPGGGGGEGGEVPPETSEPPKEDPTPPEDNSDLLECTVTQQNNCTLGELCALNPLSSFCDCGRNETCDDRFADEQTSEIINNLKLINRHLNQRLDNSRIVKTIESQSEGIRDAIAGIDLDTQPIIDKLGGVSDDLKAATAKGSADVVGAINKLNFDSVGIVSQLKGIKAEAENISNEINGNGAKYIEFESGEFTDSAQSDLDAVSQEFSDKLDEIRFQASNLFDFGISSGSGSLPSTSFDFNGTQVEIDINKYSEQLSLVGLVIFALSWVAAASILFRN